MSINSIVLEERQARKELENRVRDHEWLCESASTVMQGFRTLPWYAETQGRAGVTARSQIVERICEDFTKLQERQERHIPPPAGDVIELIPDINKIKSCLNKWRKQSMQGSVAHSFLEQLKADRPSHHRIYGYQRESQILGLAYVNDSEQRPAWSIEYLIVNPHFQKQGIGRHLMQKIEQDAPQKIVLQPVGNALPFYEKLGFYLNMSVWIRKEGLSMYKMIAPLVDEGAWLVEEELRVRGDLIGIEDRDRRGLSESKALMERRIKHRRQLESMSSCAVTILSDKQRAIDCLNVWKTSETVRTVACGFLFKLQYGISSGPPIYAYEDNGHILGLGCVEKQENGAVLLEYLVVDPSRHRQGIGRRIVHQLARDAKKIEVRPFLEAVGFYKKMGFCVDSSQWPHLVMYKSQDPLSK